ncbi:unnamed protein product (macronuclear) [Paramecium tetraurelia]|uniref:SPX domain-containing protein n=1 Tax=Paramecium tetraurelia TaxID=5888 RepID=A0E2E5_PARTE|nr:uncharacterized protein GSPATT00022634001 [Paramecium tetraurelia]CAK89462.1 unnamed protein product [Paramecium tetraurelia]|eukprot:XP_001456859.1 hypothetical protein (macronuclear) [Paramecium tetraurelia strain d4-2]
MFKRNLEDKSKAKWAEVYLSTAEVKQAYLKIQSILNKLRKMGTNDRLSQPDYLRLDCLFKQATAGIVIFQNLYICISRIIQIDIIVELQRNQKGRCREFVESRVECDTRSVFRIPYLK